MNFTEFSKKIADDSVGGAYLLHGEEEYIKDLAVQTIVEKYVAAGLEDLNLSKIDMSDGQPDVIEQAIIQLPFMSPKRVVIVHSHPVFSLTAAQAKQQSNAEKIDKIKEMIDSCPSETLLLFLVRGQAASALRKVFDDAERNVEFKYPQAAQKVKYLIRMAKECDLNLPQKSASFLMEYTGMELLELSGEIRKLKAYARNEQVTQDDIMKVCPANVEYNIFNMLKLISQGRGSQAILEYRRLVSSGQSPQAVISMIDKQYRAIFYMDEINDADFADYKSIANRLSTKDFVIRNMASLAKRLDREKIKNIARWCADADYLVKRGEIGIQDSAEMLIIRLIDIH